MDFPSVTVIVPVRNEVRTLPRTLASLRAQDWPTGLLEILVVDGLSTDGTADAARRFGSDAAVRVRVIENLRRTAAAAMNAGLRVARGDVIVRLDGHAEAAPDFVRTAVEALGRTGADCVGGPIETVGEGPTGRAIAAAMSCWFGTGGAAFRTRATAERVVDTVAFGAYRREAFARAGAFDETFVRDQDDEFHLRLTRAGGRIVLVPALRVVYRCRESFGALARQYFAYGVWKPRVLAKHGCLGSARAFAPAAFVAAFVAALVASVAASDVSGDVRWVLAVAAPYLAANVAASAVAASRSAASLLPRIAVAFATMHFAYGVGFWTGLVAPPREDERARIRRVFARRDARGAAAARPALVRERTDAARSLLAAEGLLPGPAARILDVGCGRGDSAGWSDGAYFGVDLVEARVAAARESRPRARVAAADAAALPFRDGAFDLCLLFTVMSSIKDPALRRDVAAEALRATRPRGAVVVYDFAANPLNADVRGVPVRSLRRLFPGCRVEVRRVRGPVRWLPTHYVALVRRAGETPGMTRPAADA